MSAACFYTNDHSVPFTLQYLTENTPQIMTCARARKKNERHVTPKSTLSHAAQGFARFFLNQNVAGQETPVFCSTSRPLSCTEEALTIDIPSSHEFGHYFTPNYLRCNLTSSFYLCPASNRSFFTTDFNKSAV